MRKLKCQAKRSPRFIRLSRKARQPNTGPKIGNLYKFCFLRVKWHGNLRMKNESRDSPRVSEVAPSNNDTMSIFLPQGSSPTSIKVDQIVTCFIAKISKY